MSNSTDSFFRSIPFAQSEYWQKFQHEQGKNTRVLKGSGWRCLLVEQRTQLGSYWIAFHGPTVKDQVSLQLAVKSIVAEAKKENISWIVIEPWGNNISPSLASKLTFRAYKDYNPALTSIINTKNNEASLRSALSPTYRNIINRAQGRGISCGTSRDPNDIDIFLHMLHHVEKNNQIRLHTDHYFRTQAATLMPINAMRLELAYCDTKPIAAAIIIDSDEIASYVYAASLREARKLEPGTVLLWHAIMEAKKRGKTWFDLFGVAPPAMPGHAWAGFSTFKRKFGGTDIALGGTWEIPIDLKRYFAYRASLPLIRKLQKRGF